MLGMAWQAMVPSTAASAAVIIGNASTTPRRVTFPALGWASRSPAAWTSDPRMNADDNRGVAT